MTIAATNGMTAVSGIIAPTEVISAAAQVQVLAKIQSVMDLFPDPTAETPRPGHPDLNHLHPIAVGRIRIELTNLKTIIDAAPAA